MWMSTSSLVGFEAAGHSVDLGKRAFQPLNVWSGSFSKNLRTSTVVPAKPIL